MTGLPRLLFLVWLTLPLSLQADPLPWAYPRQWTYTAPLIAPEKRTTASSHAQKDPSVVYHEGLWHVFMTVKLEGRSAIEHVAFSDWTEAHRSRRTLLPICDTTYFCAPQVFYYRPHACWYLIYQVGGVSSDQRKMWVGYSTTKTIEDPLSWSHVAPIPSLDGGPKDPRNVGGLDYWMIADDARFYLFYTSNNGRMWRLSTTRNQFPEGFAHCELAFQGEIFEASHIYKVKGHPHYLAIIEEDHRRYQKALIADRLDGEWTVLGNTPETAFASWHNCQPAAGVTAWTTNMSHGELIRSGVDERLEIDPNHWRFLFQGMRDEEKEGQGYGGFPWRLALLQPAETP